MARPLLGQLAPSKMTELRSVEANLIGPLNLLLALPILDGRLIQGIALTVGQPITFPHLLGRALVGWILTDNTAQATIWRQTNAMPDKQITLAASATTQVAVWVF